MGDGRHSRMQALLPSAVWGDAAGESANGNQQQRGCGYNGGEVPPSAPYPEFSGFGCEIIGHLLAAALTVAHQHGVTGALADDPLRTYMGDERVTDPLRLEL